MRQAHVHLVLILFLCSRLFCAAQTGLKQFTVEDIFGSQKFSPNLLRNIDWLKTDGRTTAFTCLMPGDSTHIWSIDCATGERTLLLDADSLKVPDDVKPFRINHMIWSPDNTKILFTGTLHARRTKTGGTFFLYDLSTREFTDLTPTTGEEQSNVKFSPDGTKIGFVRSNNLFVIDIASRKETRLTADGAAHVINGHFDWVYEEEFGIIDGWAWSPDGSRIAFWRLDENRVPKYILYNDGPQHAEPIETRYPQPGDSNSVVRIGIIQLSTTRDSELRTRKEIWADLGADNDIYIPRIYWTPDGSSLFIERLNRRQNRLELLRENPATGSTSVLLTESDSDWIEINDDFHFIGRDRGFVWASEREGFDNLYFYDMNGKLVRRLTPNEWDIEKCVGVDTEKGLVYFTAAGTNPIQRYLYDVSIDGGDPSRISDQEGNHSIAMSPDCRYYIDDFSTFTFPVQQNLCMSDGSMIKEVGGREPDRYTEYAMGIGRFFSFKTSDNVELNCWMITPPGFDPSIRYPVLLDIYGGPGSQTVENRWGGAFYLWDQMLAEKGYVIVSVDNRGTGFRGKAFKQITFHHLGKWEVNDYIETAKYLGSLPYIDKDRIGIWGWSYGGYMTALTMCLGADCFKCGVAVAPVTHWQYYDDIYTERYMGTPESNPEGYKESSPITYASRLKGKLLIIHGTDDDNVHMQNTISFIDALEKANKQFDLMLYPGKDHGIGGRTTRVNLFTKITDFIEKNL